MPIRAFIIHSPERKIRLSVVGHYKVGTEPLHIGFRLFVESPSTHLPPQPETQAVGVFICPGYTHAGNESNSAWSRQRDWWLWSERAHMRTAKLASSTKRLTGTVAPFGTFVEGTLAKARFVHHSGYSR